MAPHAGRVQPLRGLDSLPVFRDHRFQLGLPGCFANCLTLRVELVLVGVVVGGRSLAVALAAVGLATRGRVAVGGEAIPLREDAAFRTGSRIIGHQAGE
jgi:hypothetical protein